MRIWTGRTRKVLTWLGALVALGGLGFLGWYQLVKHGYLRYNRYDRRERGSLRVGDSVADVALTGYDGQAVQLSSLWKERPLFLVFGSCT